VTLVVSGKRTVGDVCADAFATAGAMTPVPGGVGPMTIAMLLSNTMTSFKRRTAVKGDA
jgi:methylenetetrahydrofolate dehydrogenase (NADP+)/methenyltetrahydrofolate cyclohydrolase